MVKKRLILFIVITLVVTLTMELTFSPEKRQIWNERGTIGLLTSMEFIGTIIFLFMYGIIGGTLHQKKIRNPAYLGILSLIIGHICEFTFMRPAWVRMLLGEIPLNQNEVTLAIMISSIFWFIAWAIPAYITGRLKLR